MVQFIDKDRKFASSALQLATQTERRTDKEVNEPEGDMQREKKGVEESVDETAEKRCRSSLLPSHRSYFSEQFWSERTGQPV